MDYIPERGDIIWLTFDPQTGHEQSGRRPALVLSPAAYNGKVGLALCCPITSRVKGYPFEVEVSIASSITGVVLSDQVKTLDWRTCHAEFAYKLPEPTMREILEKLSTLLSLEAK